MYLIMKEITRHIGNSSSRTILGYKKDEESAKKVVENLREQPSTVNPTMAWVDYYYEEVKEYED